MRGTRILISKADREVYDYAVKKYGAENQLYVAIEEMSELTKEICKSLRFSKPKFKRKVTEEMADCLIMFDQIKMIYNISDDDLEMWRLDKMVRLKDRLELLPKFRGGADE